MSKTLSLFKVLLKNGTGSTGRSGRKIKVPAVLLPVVLILAMLPLMLTFSKFVGFLYDGLAAAELQGMIPALALAIASVVIFVFGIVYVINIFFFAQDVEHLLPLPLTPAQILTAKFGVTLLYEYLTALLILGPVLITYGVKSGGSVLYYVYAVVIFLVLPVIPLVIASVIAMVIMRFTNVAKNKDLFRMVGGVLAVLLAIGFNLLVQRQSSDSMNPDQVQEMLKPGNNALIDMSSKAFPTAKFGANALIHPSEMSGLANLGLFLGITGLVFLVFLWLGQKLYFGSVAGLSESSGKRVLLSGEQLEKQTASRSVLSAYLTKEFRILFRTPPFFLNCVLMGLLMPVILCIPILSQPGLKEMLGSADELLAQDGISSIVLAGAFAVFLFVAGSNATASTTISREGAGFFVNKFLPVPFGKVLLAKVMTGWLLTMISVVLLLAVALFLLGAPATLVLLMLAVAIPGTLFTCLTGVLVDLANPKLNWDNEQKAVKQNLNSLYNMLIAIVTAGIIVFGTVKLELGLTVTFAAIFVIMAAVDFALYRMLMTRGQRMFDRIEV